MLLSEIAPEALPFVTLPGAFSAQELDEIERIGDGLVTGKATLAGMAETAEIDSIRICETAWLQPAAETQWLYTRMSEIVQSLNAQFYQFALTGFSDPFQYTVYSAAKRSHYGWHTDHGAKSDTPRKLSLLLLLSDPVRYEGCDVQTRVGIDDCPTSRERGTVIAFPAYVQNRVTPITAGTAKSLVAWAAGPRFK